MIYRVRCVQNVHRPRNAGFQPSRPDARDGRDRVVECGRPPTGGPVRSDRKEQTFFPSLSSLRDSFHYGKNEIVPETFKNLNGRPRPRPLGPGMEGGSEQR